MFASEAQQAAVCETLCRLIDRAGLWRPDGPTPDAVRLLADPGRLSSGEALIVKAAFDVWNGGGRMPLGRALAVLDARLLGALGALLVALAESGQQGGAPIEAWLRAHGWRWKAAS